MLHSRPFLGPALAISLVLHAALLFVKLQETSRRAPAPPPELTVRLPPPPVPAVPATLPDPQPVPRLALPPDPPKDASAPPPVSVTRPKVPSKPAAGIEAPAPSSPPSTDVPQRLSGEAARRAAEQLARDLPYPAEAIERGWQGEALVLIFLDAGGNAIAARLETSSGHAILDEAAVRAARGLRALPAGAPREALLPVRFRLR